MSLNANAKEWVQALRSGKYAQGWYQLKRDDDRFCCLGVACELAMKAGVIKRYEPSNGALPRSVRLWLGLKHENGDYGTASLANDNDHGKSFGDIADIIESEPDGLFRRRPRKRK
jgi:hypothetical protein